MATHRQNQTHDQEYLRKVAAEGYAVVGKFHGWGTTGIFPPPPPLAPPTPQLYDDREHHRDQYNRQQTAVMNSQQEAQKFGNMVNPNNGMREPATVFGRLKIPAPRKK
ncbi:hypothetical protein Dsin_028875 [Dipteronia sinensis]|uniref:Uncharacterized protein n=1 Tax=Dipteronia sinensis TaxID=43782 RepID=A0AAD9ZRZ4_9ROSI|nr:hypothetical protein Dsin_028875 [Dipteronia sinensis]